MAEPRVREYKRRQLTIKVTDKMAAKIRAEAERRDVPEAQVAREWMERGSGGAQKGAEE